MAAKGAVRRIAGRWPAVLIRVEGYVRRMPREGVTLAAFADAVLRDVDPKDVGEVVRHLHGKRVVWVSDRRGVVRVYPAKPASLPKLADKPEPIERFVTDVARPIMAAGLAVDARERATGAAERVEARYAVEVACDRVLDVVERYRAAGLTYAAMRPTLWGTFAPRIMEAVAARRPMLDEHDTREPVDVVTRPPRRIAPGLTLEGKLEALIVKSATKGMSKTELAKAIRPRPNVEALNYALGTLEEAGRAHSGMMKLGLTGRPGLRFFAPDVPLPRVDAKGRAILLG